MTVGRVLSVLSSVRFYGVMVSTLDFESNDPGSNPGETFCHGSSVGQSAWLLTMWSWVQVPLVTLSSIAQLAERSAVNR